MPRRANVQREARERIQRLVTFGLPIERLAVDLVAVVQAVAPGDGYRLFGIDPVTMLINRLLAASAEDGWARLEWLRDVYLANDRLIYREHHHLARLRLPAVAIHAKQATCWGYPSEVLGRLSAREHERIYHELRSPVGGALIAQFADAGRWIAALQLYRRDRARPFLPEDVTFLRQVSPLIGQALGAALRREAAIAPTANGDEAAGVLLLTAERELTVTTPAGERWLRRLRDADRDGHAPLPTAVWSAVAGLRSAGEVAGTVTVPTTQGVIRVEASPAGPDGSVAIVLAPLRPPDPRTIPVGWDLTLRERSVVELVLRGLTNRQIAERLFISENTVEFHLRHIYEKLDVTSRSQVLARFFRETHWPELQSSVG